jgi:tagaturonate reductase
MTMLPETILQFGAGRFLRAFADLFIHQANVAGQNVGRIVILQSTGDDRAGGLNRQRGRYHVVLRGLENGAVVDRVETVESVSRAVVAVSQWDEVRSLARSPDLRLILSNTTETGYDLNPADRLSDAPPRSFPAKLLAVLWERFGANGAGLTIVPCELRENNAEVLQKLLLQLARDWAMPQSFQSWLTDECVWLNTLVDRIVTGTPREHPLLAEDAMLTVCEPYALWAIHQKPKAWRFLNHPAVVWTDDVTPYFLRKVRILNGGHTALVIKARPRGFVTVREAVNDPEMSAWLERLFFEEIVPTLEGRVEGPKEFARQVLERFRNPFVDHKLADIAAHHETKVEVRLMPTRAEYIERFGRTPPLLAEVLDGSSGMSAGFAAKA